MAQMNTLQLDIDFVDPGIEARPIQTSWGHIVNLYRQDKPTKWKIWLFANGACRITKPETETISAVDIKFSPHEQLEVREWLTHFIQRGLI